MHPKYITPLHESTIHVLSTMAMTTATAEKPFFKTGSTVLGDVTGLIQLSGNGGNASLAISFSSAAIFEITEKILAERFNSINETIVDVVGEITNMITGNVKRIFSESGMDFNLSLPTMKIGHYSLDDSDQNPAIVLPFSTDQGKLFVVMHFND